MIYFGELTKGLWEPLGLMMIKTLELCWQMGTKMENPMVCPAGG